jgi:hypothetical protein
MNHGWLVCPHEQSVITTRSDASEYSEYYVCGDCTQSCFQRLLGLLQPVLALRYISRVRVGRDIIITDAPPTKLQRKYPSPSYAVWLCSME